MLRITRQTDYGIVLMTRMASEAERIFSAPELASEARLPLPTVSKILKLLARGSLLASHRGINGGYSLARDPGQVSVSEIIAALEGPIAVTECIDDSPGECEQVSFCPVHSNWNRINQAIRQALDSISLAEMAQPLPEADRLVQLGGKSLEGGQRPCCEATG